MLATEMAVATWSLTVTQIPRGSALVRCLASAWTLLCLPMAAYAHLGGDTASVTADRTALKAELSTSSNLQYDEHDLTLPSGTVVHEYATRDGRIFALSWRGPLPPDLSQLLGSYFPRFTSAAASAQMQPGLQRQLSSVQPDFVVQSMSHLRSYRGKAYLPGLVPDGVSVEQLP